MWPFKKIPPAPPPVTKYGVTARYQPALKQWAFRQEGMEFWLASPRFDEAAFGWAREAGATIRALDAPLRACVRGHVEHLKSDQTKARIAGTRSTGIATPGRSK